MTSGQHVPPTPPPTPPGQPPIYTPPDQQTVVIPPPGQYPQQPPQQYGQHGQYQYPQQSQHQQYGQYPQPGYPQGQQYTSAYPAQSYGQPLATGYEIARPGGSVLLGMLTLVAGGIAIGSTFLAWISASSVAGISASASGLLLMTSGSALGGSGFNMVLTSEGAIFFTGFFSLLFGALIVIAAIITMFRRRPGGIIAFLLALCATAIAAIDVTMVFAKVPGASPGIGLWMFAGASLVALVLGIISLSSSS